MPSLSHLLEGEDEGMDWIRRLEDTVVCEERFDEASNETVPEPEGRKDDIEYAIIVTSQTLDILAIHLALPPINLLRAKAKIPVIVIFPVLEEADLYDDYQEDSSAPAPISLKDGQRKCVCDRGQQNGSGNQQSWSLSKSEITGPREIEGSNPGKAAFRRVLVGITNLGRVPHCSAFAVLYGPLQTATSASIESRKAKAKNLGSFAVKPCCSNVQDPDAPAPNSGSNKKIKVSQTGRLSHTQ
ncbi:hypothetical protein B0H11DRAFT_1938678 [Mycena galericulata]|nr:hypothetical protein B0H11DRAFT_1938678 [Mycena galericulata]